MREIGTASGEAKDKEQSLGQRGLYTPAQGIWTLSCIQSGSLSLVETRRGLHFGKMAVVYGGERIGTEAKVEAGRLAGGSSCSSSGDGRRCDIRTSAQGHSLVVQR